MADFFNKAKALWKGFSSGIDTFLSTGSIREAYNAGRNTYNNYMDSFKAAGGSITGGMTPIYPQAHLMEKKENLIYWFISET